MSLAITTEFTIKPGAGQTQEQAEAEFVSLFRDYLTARGGDFQTDYGPKAWGGYEGPRVTSVTVCGPADQQAEVAVDRYR